MFDFLNEIQYLNTRTPKHGWWILPIHPTSFVIVCYHNAECYGVGKYCQRGNKYTSRMLLLTRGSLAVQGDLMRDPTYAQFTNQKGLFINYTTTMSLLQIHLQFRIVFHFSNLDYNFILTVFYSAKSLFLLKQHVLVITF